MGRFGSLVLVALSVTAACAARAPGATSDSTVSTQGPHARPAQAGSTEVAAPSERSGSPDDHVHAFMAASAGEVRGRVVGADGPIAKATVYLVSREHERTVTTDDKGQFKANVVEPTMVIVYGAVELTGSTATTQQVDGAEAIAIRDAEPPAKPAKLLSDPRIIPSYTRALHERNAWVRIWFLVDVSDTGAVSRVKLLNTPGLDLEPIAVKAAFKLAFEPARNLAGKPTASLVTWKFDWPPSVWNRGDSYVRPDASRLPCRRSETDRWFSLNKPYRDCSLPNMSIALTAPWIDRPTK